MMVKELFDRVRHARSDREKILRRNKAGMLALGVSIGCTVGAVAGLLLAPKSGKETREDVSRRSSEVWQKVKDSASTNGHRMANAIEELGTSVCTAGAKGVQSIKENIQDIPDKAEKAGPKKIAEIKE